MASFFLSGPVSALPREKAEHNFDTAVRAVEMCVANNPDVFGEEDLFLFVPTDCIPEDYDHEDAMAQAIHTLVAREFEMLISIPGWRHSPGAKLEREVADAIGVPTIDLEDFVDYYLGDIADVEFNYKY